MATMGGFHGHLLVVLGDRDGELPVDDDVRGHVVVDGDEAASNDLVD